MLIILHMTEYKRKLKAELNSLQIKSQIPNGIFIIIQVRLLIHSGHYAIQILYKQDQTIMSDYDDDDNYSNYDDEKPRQIFHYDNSLLTSVETINQWKQNLSRTPLDYFQHEKHIIDKQYELFSCGNQLRVIGFCQMLGRGFQELVSKYEKTYAKVGDPNFDHVSAVGQLDSELKVLSRYLQLVEANNVTSLYTQVAKYEDGMSKIYENVRKLVDYCFDLDTLWLTILTPRMFRQEFKENLYRVNYGGSHLFYEKELFYLLERIKRAQISEFKLNPKNESELLANLSIVLNSTKLKPNFKTKMVSLLKGKYYNMIPNKSLKQEFILSSFQMYNGEEISEIWDYERYENLCIQTLKKAFTDDDYLDCALYMEPENIQFSRRKRTLEFAEIYYTLIRKINNLNPNKSKDKMENQLIWSVEVPKDFIYKLAYGQNIQLFAHLLVNFLISNKNAFSLNTPNFDKLLFGILEEMRQMYLSFGNQSWHVSTPALAALTNKFFTKFSQDIKEDIVALLPSMVQSLGEDRLPNHPLVVRQEVEGKAQYKLEIVPTSRSELLMAIFLYIRDAEFRDSDFYLDLPQVTPINLQTAIMFVRSLELKLRHHEPTEDQKKLWAMVIEESINQFKIHIKLKWFKPKRRLDVDEREGEFLIHKQIKEKWAFDLVQEVLNWRDDQKYDDLEETGAYREISLDNDLIGYFKYCINLDLVASKCSSSLDDYQLFGLLEKMRNLLDINFGDIVHISTDQMVTLNQLHLCLKFYNTKIESAKGNEIYMLIVHKILLPWMESEDKQACEEFEKKFPQFFLMYIMQEYYLTIGDAIVTLLANKTTKTDNLLYKIDYYTKLLSTDEVRNNSLDINAELLQRIYSVLDDEVDVSVMVSIMMLLLKFLECQSSLEDQYVSLSFFVDFICQPNRIDQFLVKIEQLDYNNRLKINIEIIKKLPQKLELLTLNQINEILKTHINSQNDHNEPEKFIKILETIPADRNTLLVVLLKALTAERNKLKAIEKVKENHEACLQEDEKAFKYWKMVQDYVNLHQIQRKKGEEQVYLAKVAQLFEETVFKTLLEDYKRVLQIEGRKKNKKSSTQNKESEMSSQEDETIQKWRQKEVHVNDKYKEARIWRKVVRTFGTFQDIILFGEDPLSMYGSQEDEIYDKCLKIIEEKSIQQKYLKRIIRKLPILHKCSEEVVKKINQENNLRDIQPELLCKLIMINSRYRSRIVQEFILGHISKVPIPIKIYQDYLVLQVKRKLEHVPKNLIHEMLFETINSELMRKIDQIFDQIIYLPIKKFQNVVLKFEQKIEENIEGEEWQTESEGNADEEEEEQEQAKTKKKKKQKQQTQEQHVIECSEPEDAGFSDEVDQQIEGNDDDEDNDEDDDEDDEENDHEERQDIVEMFHIENDPNLPRYKQLMNLREQANVSFEENYCTPENLEKKVKADSEVEKIIFRIVDILQNQISKPEIVKQILNKTPKNLYQLLKTHGLTKEWNSEAVQKYRKQTIKMQRFIKDYMSDRDENSENDNDDYDYDGEDNYDDDQNQLSEETNSVADDMFDGLGDGPLFVVNEEGQMTHINTDILADEEADESNDQHKETSELKMVENLEKDADDSLSLPQLKQINSKIELQLTGKQLTSEDMSKILEISILKLFSLHSYQLKSKPVYSFYVQLLSSKQGKLFIDSLLTVLRVDELYNDSDSYHLAKKLSFSQLSIAKALLNLMEIAADLSTQQSEQNKQFENIVKDDVGSLLPIGDEIFIKSDIPVQDNILTLLIMYSRYNKNNQIRDKLRKVLANLVAPVDKQYQLNRKKAAVLAKHIYNNSNSSSIWNSIEEKFMVNINLKTKAESCLSVYGELLRADIEKCYQDLLEIVKVPIEFHNDEEKKSASLLIKQQEKKVEQNLKKHFKRIKHYYYWNKKIINEAEESDEDKLTGILKNKSLIQLTELMIFYCHFLKKRFFDKIDASTMKNLLLLPKSIIEISFMYIWKMEGNIEKWEPLTKVKQYFDNFKLYMHEFTKLQEVCNLVLEFLEMPEFSNAKFKEVIIPYFTNNPQMAHDIPLIFKLPDIPEDLNGQKVYLTRECSFDMSFYQLVSKSILVEFHNQEGSDHGGMVREFMMGWSGTGIGEEFVFIGKLLAISFRKSIPYGGDFDLAMAIAITQHKVTIQFMEQVDPEIAQSLKYIRDNDPQDIEMKFQITRQVRGVVKHYPLIPNGQEIAVTNENKQEFLKLFLENYYVVGRQWEIEEVCIGFFSIVHKKYASIFSPFEMIQKIQGEEISDYTKLKKKTKYEQGYTESSQMIKWFWEIIAQFNQKQMNKFLQFITGAPKVSIYNHNFSFVIEKPYGEDETRLPVAHTCFNTLELPEYKTKQILEKKLTQAIYEGNDSFGIL